MWNYFLIFIWHSTSCIYIQNILTKCHILGDFPHTPFQSWPYVAYGSWGYTIVTLKLSKFYGKNVKSNCTCLLYLKRSSLGNFFFLAVSSELVGIYNRVKKKKGMILAWVFWANISEDFVVYIMALKPAGFLNVSYFQYFICISNGHTVAV